MPFADVPPRQQSADRLCGGCPLMDWPIEGGSRQNICLALGRSEGPHAEGMIYGGVVIRHRARARPIKQTP